MVVPWLLLEFYRWTFSLAAKFLLHFSLIYDVKRYPDVEEGKTRWRKVDELMKNFFDNVN